MRTRIFWSGNSQAVRIPVGFRFDTDLVEIYRADNGDIVLRPASSPGDGFLALFDDFDESFIAALEGRDLTPPQERGPG